MERRSFLALLASAPIAALAPLPTLLPTPDRMMIDPLPATIVSAIRSAHREMLIISGGVGYVFQDDRVDVLSPPPFPFQPLI